jgi:hypothetical protein
VERLQLREERGQRVRLVERGGWWAVVEEREAEREVGRGRLRERLEEDIDDYIGVVQIGVELIAVRVSMRWVTGWGAAAYSLRIARLARQSYSYISCQRRTMFAGAGQRT